MNLQEAFEQGKVAGISGMPERIIETLISKLYFFGDDVYKVYKYNKAFFGDFSDSQFRHDFYNDDFTWNNTMSPDIYLELKQVEEYGNDYYIHMKRIDDTQTLLNLVKENNFKKEDLELITEELFKRTEKLTELKKADLKDLFEMPYVDLDLRNLGTTRDWLRMGEEIIPKEEADALISKLKKFIETSSYFKDFKSDSYLASVDNHGGNILFSDNKVNFIDSMPPMRIWRMQSDAYSISRPATDLEVLVGKEYSDVMFKKFEEVRNTKLDPKMRAYLQTVAALIQAPYMYVLKETELANKFWDFAKKKAIELN